MTPSVDFDRAIGPQIYRRLRNAIVTMELRPGQALSEQEIAARFGVSRQPVREAFIKLREARLVRVRPQRGTFVERISITDVMNARFIREAVETAIVRMACAIAPAEALGRLDDNLAGQARAAADGDQMAFMALDEAFHQILADSIDCRTAWPILEDVKVQMDRVRFLSLAEATPASRLLEQHREIRDTVVARDGAAAAGAMERHLREILVSLPRLAREHPDLFEDSRVPAHAARVAGPGPGDASTI